MNRTPRTQVVPGRPAPHWDPAGAAFTRLDLIVLVAVLALVGGTTLSAMTSFRSRADRVVCLNNLRRIGGAFHQWAQDRGGQFPGQTPRPVGLAAGSGLPISPAAINAWVHFAMVTNELEHPRILLCPADTSTNLLVSTNWNVFFAAAGRQNSMSYFLGVDASLADAGNLLAGDRNIRTSGPGAGCRSLPANVTTAVKLLPGDPAVGWTGGVHELVGNVLGAEGAAFETDSRQLRNWIKPVDNGSYHLLLPR